MTNVPAAQDVTTLFDQPDRRDLEFGCTASSPSLLPTAEAYGQLNGVYDYFNKTLFKGKLLRPVLTLTRNPRVGGYFCAGAFQNLEGSVAHELSLNPFYIDLFGDDGFYAVLVHEMCHLARYEIGGLNRKRQRRDAPGYHSAVWGSQMQAVGLMPSHTGKPGGRRTGYSMSHYVIKGGPFDLACRELLISGERINWRGVWPGLTTRPAGPEAPASREPGTALAPARNTRTRFICPVCDVKAWSRASARLACTDCDTPLLAR